MFSSNLSIDLLFKPNFSLEKNRLMMIENIEQVFSSFREGVEELEINFSFDEFDSRNSSDLEDEDENDAKASFLSTTAASPAHFKIFDVLDAKISAIAHTIQRLSISININNEDESIFTANNLELLKNSPQRLTALKSLDISIMSELEVSGDDPEEEIIYDEFIKFLNRFEHRHLLNSFKLALDNIVANEDDHVTLTSEFLSPCQQLTEIAILKMNYVALPEMADMFTSYLSHHPRLESLEIDAYACSFKLTHLNQILQNTHLKKISWASTDLSHSDMKEKSAYNIFFLKHWAEFAKQLSKARQLQDLRLQLDCFMNKSLDRSPAFYDQFYYYFTKGLMLNRSLLKVEIAYSLIFEHLHLLCPFLLQVGANPHLLHLELPSSIPKSIDGLPTILPDLKIAYEMSLGHTRRILEEQETILDMETLSLRP